MNKYALALVFICLVGCMTPSQRFSQQVLRLGFKSQLLKSIHFQHRVYLAKEFMEGEVLHVYLDGDGTPWERNRWIADDPTARNPLILQLMNQDTAPAILLGRPCYYGLSQTDSCDNKYWTSHRYSKQVVDSMSQVLNTWLEKYQFKEIVLIGYSGGGTIAVLMADKIKNIVKVVTVAANLDVTKWSEFHGFSTLTQSLNPAERVKLNPEIKQIHFAGKQDKVVPSFIIKAYVETQNNAKYYEFPDKNHSCCWNDGWGELLEFIK